VPAWERFAGRSRFKAKLRRRVNLHMIFGHKRCGSNGRLENREGPVWGLRSTIGDKRPDTGFGSTLDLNVEASSEGNLLDSGDLCDPRIAVDFGRCRGVEGERDAATGNLAGEVDSERPFPRDIAEIDSTRYV
jgi:hypothetical protein